MTDMEGWTFLTNHSHVLLSIAADPEIRLRDAAQRVGITERAAQRIVADLIEAGYLTSTKVGRRNRYVVNPERRLRHPIEQHCRIESLLSLISKKKTKEDRQPAAAQRTRAARRPPASGEPYPGKASYPAR